MGKHHNELVSLSLELHRLPLPLSSRVRKAVVLWLWEPKQTGWFNALDIKINPMNVTPNSNLSSEVSRHTWDSQHPSAHCPSHTCNS